MGKVMPKKQIQKVKPVKAWAGICEGKIHCWGGEARYYEIYPTRAQAKVAYETFIPILITPIKRRSR